MNAIGPSLLRFSDLVGVGVFAVSGALAAGRKKLDLFGALVIAVVTAIGGGTLRDLLLGRLPVFWVRDAIYLPIILGATIFTVLYTRFRSPPVRMLLVADALGLSLFAISGAEIAQEVTRSAMVIILMGVISGVAGGVVRDVLCAEIPLILRSGRLYATAALGGTSVFYVVQGLGAPHRLAAGLGMLTVLTLRMASIFFGLTLPVYEVRHDRPEKSAGFEA
ncbi:MAG: trimeric intracellular cation channel family protein [Thermoanaerobaculia bacterium]